MAAGFRCQALQHTVALIILLQAACSSVAALQGGRLLPLDPHRRRQILSEAGISLPEPTPIHIHHTPQQNAQPAQYITTSASRLLTAEAPLEPGTPPATDEPVIQEQLIEEPDVGVTAGNISVSADPTAETRPFKVGFFDEPRSWPSPRVRDYVMGKLVPAAASVLARSIRVRRPTGTLPLLGYPDERGNPIPDIFGNGNVTGGIDADIVFKVTTEREDNVSPFGAVCVTAAAFAYAFFTEAVTGRPIYGIITLCNYSPETFHADLETMLHEMIHPLVFTTSLYGQYPGYKEPYFDVVLQTENVSYIQSPQVRAAVRRHFNCSEMRGAALEDDLGRGSAGAHWEMRLFRGEVMNSVARSVAEASGQRAVLTDLTLAIFQDSNWYDVKYGSAGFDSFGYRAGCEFAMGTYEAALTVPAAQPFLCNATKVGRATCLWDASASATCFDDSLWDGFLSQDFSRLYDFECHNAANEPGQRCLQRGSDVGCVDMACSPAGRVLINGKPCNPGTMECPDEELMCGDPGLLTCVDTLNDCSGRGDCFMGDCFCHIGWGGNDCSVPICLSKCDDGSPCPPSGFCGVPECGEWSVGSESRGLPCKAPANFSEPPLVTYESTGEALAPAESPAESPTASPAESPAPAPNPPPLASPSEDDYSDAEDSDYPPDDFDITGVPPIGTPGVRYPPPASTAPSTPSSTSASPAVDGEAVGDLEGSGVLCAMTGALRAAVIAAAAAGAVAAW